MKNTLLDQLTVLGHAHRMSVFQLLVRRCPDRIAAGEIARILGFKASTASVYLGALSRVGLIRQSREGTSLLYELDTDGAQAMVSDLFLDCCRARADVCPPSALQPFDGKTPMTDRKFNVLFICTGNSARSIFAEATLRHEAGDRFNAFSAGVHPSGEINPFALEILKNKGISVDGMRSKSIAEFRGSEAPRLDFVFTVCDAAANEDCPPWSGQPISGHWGLPDPARATGTLAERRLAFQQSYGMMRNRILAFSALPLETLDRTSLQTKIDEIGRESALT